MTDAAPKSEVTFQQEIFFKCMRELLPLWLDEWDEIKPDGRPLDPDWDSFVQHELAGHLLLYTMRDGVKLVGYALSIIHSHRHFKSTLCGFIDGLYILPDYRGHAEQFVTENDDLLASQHVQDIILSIAPFPWLLRVLKKLGYGRTEFMLMKRLSGDNNVTGAK